MARNTESQGSRALRQAITTQYQSINEEQILVHAGAQEAIFTFMNAVLQPNDHIIVHAPCYQSLFVLMQEEDFPVMRFKA